jgi:CTP synthase (UTP-ammonia lyase)
VEGRAASDESGLNVRRVTVLLDYPADHRYRIATMEALRHAVEHRGHDITVSAVGTESGFELRDGVVIGPGTPYRHPVAAEAAITTARERGVPLVAT